LGGKLECCLSRFVSQRSARVLTAADLPEFARDLESMTDRETTNVPYLKDLIRYELRHVDAPRKPQDRDDISEDMLFRASYIERPDSLNDQLVPALTGHVEIEVYDHDMEMLVEYLKRGDIAPALPP